jgi:phospholipid/cholesterol/gamma-HCH transport system substrate-binding protein
MKRVLANDALLGLVALSIGVAVLVLGMTGAISRLFASEETRTVRAAFADSQQLRPGDQVRIQGLEAGEVTETALSPDGRSTLVTMKVKAGMGDLYADARAITRYQTVLGGRFYVDLERGSAARGPLAQTIPALRTGRQVELDDIASVVRGDAKTGLQTLPGELAEVLRDEQAPARLLESVADAAPDIERGVGALRGEDLDADLRNLVGATSKTVAALDGPREELRTIISGAATTLGTIADRGDDVRALARRGPGTIAQVDATTARLDRTLALANPLVRKLQPAADDVAPTFRTLRPVVSDADALARRARPLVRALRPAVTSLAGAARNGLPLLRELEPSLDRLDDVILPYLAEKDSGTGKSTAVMIGGTFAGLAAGAGGQMDANGHFIRFPATVGSSNLSSIPCQVYINNPDAEQVLACQTLQEALGTYFGYQPLGPTPGTEPAAAARRKGGR